MPDVYAFDLTTIDGGTARLEAYRGRTLLIVNVASRCGYTPQYAGLERLYQSWKDRGLVVLGFPCDQFGRQEPGTEAEIRRFCTEQYGITFPLFSKIDVNGDRAHPLYKFLKTERKGLFGSKTIKWNFTKFLVGPDGRVLKRYAPSTTPDQIENDLAVTCAGAPARNASQSRRSSVTGRRMP